MKRLIFLMALLASLAFAGSESVPVFKSPQDRCKMEYTPNDSSFTLRCQNSVVGSTKFPISPGPDLKKQVESIEEALALVSVHYEEDRMAFRKFLHSKLEEQFRLEIPTEKQAIVSALGDFEKAQDILNKSPNPCPEDGRKIETTKFLDVQLDDESKKTLIKTAVDAQMKNDGFLNLGDLKDITITVQADNDNFLHGGGVALWGDKWKNDKDKVPFYEGDDRGLTYAHKLETKADYSLGSVSLSQYSKGYGQLSTVANKVKICNSLGTCSDQEVVSKYDEKGKRYQNFLSVDGIELEIRRNQVNGDYYVKLAGSIERLTDSSSGIAQAIQSSWHKAWKDQNFIQYHNLDHREDKYRVNVRGSMGVEKVQSPVSWFAVRESLEGQVSLSSDFRKNSYVGIEAGLAIDTGKLFVSDLKQPPLLQARLKLAGQKYVDGNTYTQVGARILLNLYSDKHGNIVGIYSGAELTDDPFVREYGKEEKKRRNRVDIIHSYGLYAKVPLK